MSILHSDVEISSSYYVLHVNLSSGMSSGSMNGGVWISLVGYVLGGGFYGGPVCTCLNIDTTPTSPPPINNPPPQYIANQGDPHPTIH